MKYVSLINDRYNKPQKVRIFAYLTNSKGNFFFNYKTETMTIEEICDLYKKGIYLKEKKRKEKE